MQVIRCRNHSVSINHPSRAVWCDTCNHYSLEEMNHTCQCCGNKIARRRKYHSEIQKIDKVIQSNISLINTFSADPYSCEFMPGFAIKLDYRNYLVNIKYFAEFMNMPKTKDPRIIGPFLEKIKKDSTILMRTTQVNP